MITASGAGAAFIAVPPKRLKPKPKPKVQPQPGRPQSPSSSHRSSAPICRPPPPLTPQSPPSSTRTRDIDPALAIESFLTRNRLSSSVGPRSLLEVGIGEDEWTRGFVTDDEFLSGLIQEYPSASPRSSVYETHGHSPSSSTSTIRASGTNRPSIEEQNSASAGQGAPRKLRCLRPNSHPSSSSLLLPEDPSPPPLSSSHGFGISPWNFGGGTKRHAEQQRVNKMSTVRDINIAVVGAAGVGKTTFIERAYDLKAPTRHGEVHSLTLVVDRAPCSVSLVEVDWDRIDFEKEVMKWPRVTDGQRIPFIDGVLLLYDPANPSTCSRVSECLESFDKAQLPVCLVRTKGDVPGGAFEATTTISGADGYERLQTSLTARDSQKKCMAAILALISRRNEKSPRYLNRRRANSSAANSRAASPRPSTGHNRASSEFSSTFLNDRLSDTGSIHGPARLQRPPASVASGQSLNIPGPISSSPLSSADPRKNSTFTAPQITLSSSGQTHSLDIVATNPFSMQQTSSQSSLGDPERPHPYIDTDDDDSTGFKDPDDIPILDREDALDELDEEDKPILNRGWNWDELVNRLLSQPMSRSDMIFVTIFLCFYRKFAAPRELLDAILERFKAIEHEEKFRALRIAIQLRYCNVLHQWVSSHPGDFSNPKTKKQLLAFLDSISTDRSLALLAADMTKLLQAPAEDEDDRWGRTDVDMDRPPSIQSFLTESSPTFPDCTTKAWQLSLDNPSTQLQIPGEKMTPEFDAVSPLTMGSAMGLTISKTEPLPPPSTPVTKPGGQYELFMNISITEVANELTRIDWSEFSRIRPRDLVRHINVSAECRENSPSLAPVNNMISHFNHVAYWVASVILEKPKPKHRAKALEKFMEIAWTLRHMNNYNSLGAIIAGINGTAIHRLNQTRELVNPEINKKFMRLELLMGTHKSHSKYRLAWENTTSERIPFLPLHRRDLVSAEEGNKTLLQDGEKINWSKFQIMGDVMMVLVKAQGMPYKNLEGNSTVATMISNAATTMNDDELYERSVQLEGSATSGGNKPRRNWFQLNQRA